MNRRRFKQLVLILAGAVILAGSLAVWTLDRWVKMGVESYGPRVILAPVKLGGLSLSFLGGRITVRDLSIGNPAGFSAKEAIHIKSLDLVFEPGSVFGNPLRVRRIELREPEITVENAGRRSNLSALQANAERFSATQGKPTGPVRASRRWAVARLSIFEAKVHLRRDFLITDHLNLRLPDLQLTDLGTHGPGLLPSQLLSAVIGATLHGIDRVFR